MLFEISKDLLQPSQILSIVQQLTTSLDDAVNYYEFLKLLDRAKAMSISEDVSQDGAGPHLINAMREQIHGRIGQLSQQDREVVERLRHMVRNAVNGQGVDLTQVFMKFAQRGSDKLSQDELIISMSRVSDSVSLGDIKDLFRILLGFSPGSLTGYEDAKVPINEVVQMLTL